MKRGLKQVLLLGYLLTTPKTQFLLKFRGKYMQPMAHATRLGKIGKTAYGALSDWIRLINCCVKSLNMIEQPIIEKLC